MMVLVIISNGQTILGENFVLGTGELNRCDFTLHNDVIKPLGSVESLKGKPKIVLIDACRDDTTDWDKLDGNTVDDFLKKQLCRKV